jgi:hypothetical protein
MLSWLLEPRFFDRAEGHEFNFSQVTQRPIRKGPAVEQHDPIRVMPVCADENATYGRTAG